MSTTQAIIFDTETHDTKEPEIVEAAWLAVEFGSPTIDLHDWQCRYQPSKPITLGAMAMHHITDEDVAGFDPSCTFELPECDYLIGHNIDFDWQAAGNPEGPKRICTLALARSLWPQADSHTQSALIYLLDRGNARERLRNAHGALADVHLCKTILDAIIEKLPGIQDFDDLWRESEKARVPTVITFGKWKGTPIAEVPWDYKRWLLGQPDVDEYLRKALTAKSAQKELL